MSVIAFAAGFSERWAQDTLTGGLTGRGRGPKDAPPATEKTAAKDTRGRGPGAAAAADATGA